MQKAEISKAICGAFSPALDASNAFEVFRLKKIAQIFQTQNR